jgi:hypothetical protein
MGFFSKILAISRLSFLSIFICFQTFAQDGHYWSENFGNKSMLLSGTVNASVEDLGAVFYNPGRLALIENPAFAISAEVYEWRTLKIEDALGDGIDLNKSNFGGAPSLAAGTFEVPFLKNHKFAYSFLTRQRTEADFFVRVEDEGDVVQGLPGEEIFNGKLNFQSSFNEEWIGLTWAPPATKKFSVGLSTFLSNLNRSSTIALDMSALNNENQVGYYTVNRSYSYTVYSLLWKLGMALELSKIRLGLTVTSPRVGLSTQASTLYEDYLIGVDTTGNGVNDDAYIFDIQENLKAQYRSPLAIGFGVGIPLKKGVIHLSAEWYNGVPEYTIVESNPFIGQSTGESVNFTLVDALDPVINYGIGVELYLSEKISAYGSFATDYSAVKDEITRFAELTEVANNSVFQADFWQFGGGLAITTKAVEITAGATYNGASQEFDRPISFPEEGNDSVYESGKTVTLAFSQWRFILGFSFPFVNKLMDKVEGKPE